MSTDLILFINSPPRRSNFREKFKCGLWLEHSTGVNFSIGNRLSAETSGLLECKDVSHHLLVENSYIFSCNVETTQISKMKIMVACQTNGTH